MFLFDFLSVLWVLHVRRHSTKFEPNFWTSPFFSFKWNFMTLKLFTTVQHHVSWRWLHKNLTNWVWSFSTKWFCHVVWRNFEEILAIVEVRRVRRLDYTFADKYAYIKYRDDIVWVVSLFYNTHKQNLKKTRILNNLQKFNTIVMCRNIMELIIKQQRRVGKCPNPERKNSPQKPTCSADRLEIRPLRSQVLRHFTLKQYVRHTQISPQTGIGVYVHVHGYET